MSDVLVTTIEKLTVKLGEVEDERDELRAALERINTMTSKGPFEDVDKAGSVIVAISQIAWRALKS